MLGDDKSILNRIANVNEPMNVSAVDCEVIVMFQFPPLDAKNNGGYIKGSIESMREKSNPLYFKQLDVISAAFYTAEASQILKKIDMEVIVILVCTTLACVFMGLQLYHVKTNSDMLPLRCVWFAFSYSVFISYFYFLKTIFIFGLHFYFLFSFPVFIF